MPLIYCLIFLLLAGCASENQQASKEPAPIPVTATSPVLKEITVYLESIGTLHPSELMGIRPQSSGKLIEVLITEGQTVKMGDPLFKIDPRPYEIKVHEAEAGFHIDQAGLDAVQKKMARYKDLVERDLVAKTEWDELGAQLMKAQGALELDRARLEYALLDLEYCTLHAPIDGRAGILDAAVGRLVGESSELTSISQIDPLIVEFTVTEKEFSLLPKEDVGFKLQPLCANGLCEYTSGTVTFMDNHFDEKTGQLLLRGKIRNAGHALRPGQSVRVLIPVEVMNNTKVIPQKAIRYNQNGPYIYVIQEDMTVVIRQLLLGKEHGEDQIVLEGIEPGERLILDGHLRLSAGLKVEVKP